MSSSTPSRDRTRGPYRARRRTPRQTVHNKRRRVMMAALSATTVNPDEPPSFDSEVDPSTCSVPAVISAQAADEGNDDTLEADDSTSLPAANDECEQLSEDGELNATQSSTNSCLSNGRFNDIASHISSPTIQLVSKPLYSGSILTADSSCMLLRSFANRHRLTAQCKEDLLKMLQFLLPFGNQLPRTLHMFQKESHTAFTCSSENLVEHHCCFQCFTLLPSESVDKCPNLKCKISLSSHELVKFTTLPIKRQLKVLYQRPGFFQSLKKRQVHRNPDIIADIYDGECYQVLPELAGEHNNISFVINTDGIEIFKSTKLSTWPVLMMINELPYAERRQPMNMILAGLWSSPEKPPMQEFLKPVVAMLLELEAEGIQVDPPGIESPFVIKACVIGCCCDLPARALVQNFIQFNGFYGCSFCKQPGITVTTEAGGSVHAYPYQQASPKGPSRTEFETIQQALTASNDKSNSKDKSKDKSKVDYGVKGLSWLITLRSYDFIKGMSTDYMHCALLGVGRSLINLWIDRSRGHASYGIHSQIDVLDSRIIGVKVPTEIRRKPRKIVDLKHWKASEFRSWILLYSVPVLDGILDKRYLAHYIKFVEALWLLLQPSITKHDLKKAEELLCSFCSKFEILYGQRYYTANIHQLLHFSDAVRHLGPLWAHSAFAFENANGWLLNLLHGSRTPAQQIIKQFVERQQLSVAAAQTTGVESADTYIHDVLETGHRYSITVNAGNGHLVLGKVYERCSLSSREVEALEEVLPDANFDTALVYNRLLISGVVYTNIFYKQTTTDDYTLAFKDGAVGKAIKYVSFTGTSHHFVLVYHCNCIRGPARHIRRIVNTTRNIKAYETKDIQAKCCIATVGSDTYASQLPNSFEKNL